MYAAVLLSRSSLHRIFNVKSVLPLRKYRDASVRITERFKYSFRF